MNPVVLRWVLIAVCASFGIKVFAHSRLKPSAAVVPRSTDPGLKTAPCGGAARSATPAVLAPGSTITVNWEETINHPGRYEFYFSQAGDANFTLIKTVTDDQDAAISGTAYHQFSTSLALPNVTCTSCTLQMVQVMTETNPPSLYFACADLKLQSGSTTPSPSPVPAPGPPVRCKDGNSNFP